MCCVCCVVCVSIRSRCRRCSPPQNNIVAFFASSLVSNEPDRDIDTSACLTSELNCIPPLIVDLPKQLVIFSYFPFTHPRSVYLPPTIPASTCWCGSPSTCLPTVSTCQKNNKNSTTPSTTQPPSSRTNELGTEGDDFFFGLESVPQPRPGPSPSSASARPTRQLMLAAHLRCSTRFLLDNSSRTRSAILIAPIHRSRAFFGYDYHPPSISQRQAIFTLIADHSRQPQTAWTAIIRIQEDSHEIGAVPTYHCFPATSLGGQQRRDHDFIKARKESPHKSTRTSHGSRSKGAYVGAVHRDISLGAVQ